MTPAANTVLATAHGPEEVVPGADPSLSTNRILIASYYFPPDAAVGALRLGRFARLLPMFGWEPVVLTIRDDMRGQGFDRRRLKELEGVTVVQTREWPRLWKRVRAIARPKRPATTAGALGTDASTASSLSLATVTATLKRWIVSLVVLLPDENKHWAGRAAFTAVRLIRREKVRHILTSGPPFSNHFIGVVAKCVTGVQWTADFRDPWIDMLPYRWPSTRSALSDRIERRMEALVVALADTVAVTTPRMLEAFRSRYPDIDQNRFVCITNGIDVEKFARRPIPLRAPLTITYAGSLYFYRTPEPLFRAVQQLRSSGRIAASDIRIQLVGRCDIIEGAQTRDLVARYGLEDVVQLTGPVPYDEAVRLMQQSHLLLVLAPDWHRLVVPAKIYDYLGSGSKILAIADDGATVDLIKETSSGACFSPSDTEGLREYLGELIATRTFETMGNEPREFARFDVRQITAQLAARLQPGHINGGVEVAAKR